MTVFFICLFSLVILYGILLVHLSSGFERLPDGNNKTRVPVSVIVAARNEEPNIEACLQALLAQDYPKELLQIIVVDDRSEDSTAEIVQKYARQYAHLRLIRIDDVLPGFAPKKRAIHAAIQEATGEVIFTTDADCIPGPRWIAQILTYFDPDVGMVAGYNPYRTNETADLFQKILALDYFAMAAVAAASAGLNYPVSCSGGNLAYRRVVYESINGFGDSRRAVSGDDDLFLHRVREQSGWQIRYSVLPQTFVPTKPPASFQEFLQQRIRYASKGLLYSKPVVLLLLGIFAMNAMLTTGCVYAFSDPFILLPLAAAFLAKAGCEWFFLKQATNCFQGRFPSAVFGVTSIVHPVYVTVAGLMGQVGQFSWKNDRYRKNTMAPRASLTRMSAEKN